MGGCLEVGCRGAEPQMERPRTQSIEERPDRRLVARRRQPDVDDRAVAQDDIHSSATRRLDGGHEPDH
jgi:hypothetical protein